MKTHVVLECLSTLSTTVHQSYGEFPLEGLDGESVWEGGTDPLNKGQCSAEGLDGRYGGAVPVKQGRQGGHWARQHVCSTKGQEGERSWYCRIVPVN